MKTQPPSQNGSTKIHKKRATKKKKATKVGHIREVTVLVFSPEDCELCKRKMESKEWAQKYHKGHHILCPNNKQNEGIIYTKGIVSMGAFPYPSVVGVSRPASQKMEKLHEHLDHVGNHSWQQEDWVEAVEKQGATDHPLSDVSLLDELPLYGDDFLLDVDVLDDTMELQSKPHSLPDLEHIPYKNEAISHIDGHTSLQLWDEKSKLVCKCDDMMTHTCDVCQLAVEVAEELIPIPELPEVPAQERPMLLPRMNYQPVAPWTPLPMVYQQAVDWIPLPILSPDSKFGRRRKTKKPRDCGCGPYLEYLRLKQLQTVMGRPPHDPSCQYFGN